MICTMRLSPLLKLAHWSTMRARMVRETPNRMQKKHKVGDEAEAVDENKSDFHFF